MTGLKNVRNRRDDALTRVGWDRLEAMLAEYYRGQGWSVDHVGTGGSRNRFDGGIDLKLRKDGQYVLVQCKHWNAKQVTHNAVHELLGIKVNENATGAVVITSGEFTRAAREAAQRQGHVQLIDGDALRAMLGPQLDALAASLPPPLPGSSLRPARKERSTRSRAIRMLAGLSLAALLLYCWYRLLTFPFFNHHIQVDLPARTGAQTTRPQRPARITEPPVATAPEATQPQIEQGMTDAELQEWKRKNAESMRILEENDRAEAQAARE